jgi:hypothetical protein
MGDGDGSSIRWRDGISVSADAIFLVTSPFGNQKHFLDQYSSEGFDLDCQKDASAGLSKVCVLFLKESKRR